MNPAGPIPFNIITGFLGTGKTTAIRHLLAHRPPSEHWAVLVNEFGEIGIDGALLKASGVSVKEIPGGCMCCTNGLPVQIALNFLLARKPDRLIIEPSGLGHPDEILTLLSGPYYRDLTEARATLTLIDPRKLADERYTTHALFVRQAQVADRVIATKTDQCEAEDLLRFRHWAQQLPQHPQQGEVSWGAMPLSWLDTPRQVTHRPNQSLSEITPGDALPAPWIDFALPTSPATDILRKTRQGEGFFSCGWRIPTHIQFDLTAVLAWVYALDAVRVKGVFLTPQGACAVNAEGHAIQSFSLPEAADTRVEIVHTQALDWMALEEGLLACRASASPLSL